MPNLDDYDKQLENERTNESANQRDIDRERDLFTVDQGCEMISIDMINIRARFD